METRNLWAARSRRHFQPEIPCSVRERQNPKENLFANWPSCVAHLHEHQVTSIAFGAQHTLAVAQQGEAFTWGGAAGLGVPQAQAMSEVPIFVEQLQALVKATKYSLGISTASPSLKLCTNRWSDRNPLMETLKRVNAGVSWWVVTYNSVTLCTSVGSGGCTVKGALEVRLRLLRLCIRMQPYQWCVHLRYRLLRSRKDWNASHSFCLLHRRGTKGYLDLCSVWAFPD